MIEDGEDWRKVKAKRPPFELPSPFPFPRFFVSPFPSRDLAKKPHLLAHIPHSPLVSPALPSFPLLSPHFPRSSFPFISLLPLLFSSFTLTLTSPCLTLFPPSLPPPPLSDSPLIPSPLQYFNFPLADSSHIHPSTPSPPLPPPPHFPHLSHPPPLFHNRPSYSSG
ncbi:unnamed protein product [Closterium sp. Naga37s-1]|nr:unnamed protein product [Closterium sp. Naga37s-1]